MPSTGACQQISMSTSSWTTMGHTKRFFDVSRGFGLIQHAPHRAANQVDHGDEVDLVPVAEAVLDDMKLLIDVGADAGLGLFECQQQRFHGAVFHPLYNIALGGDTAQGVGGFFSSLR
jgi:hypothetical protein